MGPLFQSQISGVGGGFFLCVYVYPPHTTISKQKEATGNGGEITMGRGLHDERGIQSTSGRRRQHNKAQPRDGVRLVVSHNECLMVV